MVVSGAQITNVAVQAAFWTAVLGLAVLVGIGIFLLTRMLYRLMNYKIEAIILDHTGSSDIARKDLGKVEKEGGNIYVKFLKSREKIPLPNPDKYIAFGNRKLLLLHKWNDLLTPMALTHNAPAAFQFNADDLVTVLRWRELDHQEALDTYSN